MTKTPQATDSAQTEAGTQDVVEPYVYDAELNRLAEGETGGSLSILEAVRASPTASVAPAERGMAHLRAQDLDPLRLWTVKSPKGVGGTLSAVFLQATSEIVLLQQLESGRFVLFNKAAQ